MTTLVAEVFLAAETRRIIQMGNRQSNLVSLPQNDENIETRNRDLQTARQNYQLEQKTYGFNSEEQSLVNVVNIPPMLRTLPKEENWQTKDLCHFACVYCLCGVYQCCWGRRQRWTIDQMVEHFSNSIVLTKPEGYKVWQEQAVGNVGQTPAQQAQTDHWFAWQRLNGVTRNLIRCVQKIPAQFEQFVDKIQNSHPYLGNMALNQHVQNGNMFVVDLTDVATTDELPAVAPISPVALFVTWNMKLMPVAIQLITNGEVYTPANLPAWVEARMWFNMMEAQYHESITHFGFTHLLMDGVSVCMHANLSDRHPIYKLLHPHFQYMHFINKLALQKLIETGGFVDRDMFFNHVHMLRLIAQENGNINRPYDLDANIEDNAVKRGVENIPGYFFKDDAVLIRNAIETFVNEYTNHYYMNNEAVQQDQEIQAFRLALTMPRNMELGAGGCGMNGIPEFNGIQPLVEVLTNFIYICSVEHSATNFPQYEQYAFPPNFPGILHILPKGTLDDILPTKEEMLSTIKIMKVLTLRLTNSLGNYEQKYLDAMDAAGRMFVDKFRQALDGIIEAINLRNRKIIENNGNNPDQIQEYPYEWLLPDKVLNSISI